MGRLCHDVPSRGATAFSSSEAVTPAASLADRRGYIAWTSPAAGAAIDVDAEATKAALGVWYFIAIKDADGSRACHHLQPAARSG